jgi:hypothetical protein
VYQVSRRFLPNSTPMRTRASRIRSISNPRRPQPETGLPEATASVSSNVTPEQGVSARSRPRKAVPGPTLADNDSMRRAARLLTYHGSFLHCIPRRPRGASPRPPTMQADPGSSGVGPIGIGLTRNPIGVASGVRNHPG